MHVNYHAASSGAITRENLPTKLRNEGYILWVKEKKKVKNIANLFLVFLF